jgi:hypothetical protein
MRGMPRFRTRSSLSGISLNTGRNIYFKPIILYNKKIYEIDGINPIVISGVAGPVLGGMQGIASLILGIQHTHPIRSGDVQS